MLSLCVWVRCTHAGDVGCNTEGLSATKDANADPSKKHTNSQAPRRCRQRVRRMRGNMRGAASPLRPPRQSRS